MDDLEIANIDEEDNITPIVNESLKEFVPIKKISSVTENLWYDTENFRNQNVEMDIEFEEEPIENNENPKKKKVVKDKKLGTAAFTSMSLMAISASIATASIIIFGVLLTK